MMLPELLVFGGVAYLCKDLIDDYYTNKTTVRKRDKKKYLKEIKKPRKMTPEETWDFFVKAKFAWEESLGTQFEKANEARMIFAEKLLQNPDKGFYIGDAVELGLEPGKAKRMPLYLKWSNLNNHYIIFGTTRFGKTRALANHMRQFIELGYNIIVIDPKGGEKHEILGWACEFAYEFGRMDDLLFYNPVFPTLTDYFNPIFGKDNNEISSELKLFAMGKQNTDDFFTKRVPQIVNAIGTACEYMEKVHDPDGSLIRIDIEEEIKKYHAGRITNGHKVQVDKDTMTMKPDVAYRSTGRVDSSQERISAGIAKRTLMTYKDFAYYSIYDNLMSLRNMVLGTPVPEMGNFEDETKMFNLREEALLLLEGAAGTSKENYEKTTGSLVELLTSLSTGSVGRMFCTIPINPLLLRMQSPDKGVIAVIQPNPLKYQSVSEMIMKVFLKNFETAYGNVAASGRLYNRRTIVIIDEASKAMFPGIEEEFNKLGGLGMQFGLYTQSQADMVMMLGKDVADVIMDNINTVGYMKTNNRASKVNASEDFGQQKIVDYQVMGQVGIGSSSRTGVSADMKDIAHADSFDELQIGEMLLKHYGKRYFVKLPYQQAPKAYMVMPQLSSEKITSEMLEFERILENNVFYGKREQRKAANVEEMDFDEAV